MSSERAPLVGLVPCAGRATRLGHLPCSKEILPVAPSERPGNPLRTASEELLEAMRLGGARRAYVVLGRGKWDIPAYLEDGARVGIPLAYLVAADSPSVVATVDRAYGFVRDAIVLFGFPDILFDPADAFARLVARLEATEADAVLGLFPAEQPERVDMVEHEHGGRVRRIVAKPTETQLASAWILAVWGPALTAVAHEHAGLAVEGREAYFGDLLQAAIDAGRHVDSVTFSEGRFRDVGAPADLAEAVREGYASGPRPTPA